MINKFNLNKKEIENENKHNIVEKKTDFYKNNNFIISKQSNNKKRIINENNRKNLKEKVDE